MSEARKTAALGGVALVLMFVTWATRPRVVNPAIVADRGELFFPQFTDPNTASSLEVIEFDEQNGTVRPLKVLNRAGRWTIPSHHDYPADARDRLARTAAAIIALRKDDVASDSAAEHVRLGVVDPIDLTQTGITGRGTRVIVRGGNERPLADIVVGTPVAGHAGYRYVRVPGQKRTFLSRVGDLSFSTMFGDWIERDLLQLDRNEIDEMTISNYSVDEATGRVVPREALLLRKNGDEEWTLDGLQRNEAVDTIRVNEMITHLAGLKIVSVLPKPPGISATLSRQSESGTISVADRDDLARKGFYLGGGGELLSNEGKVVVHTTSGLFYTLWFGEVAPGTPDAQPSAPAGIDAVVKERQPFGENRYLFIMTAFDPSSARPAGRSTTEGERRAAVLRARFASWYYIISAEGFAKIRARRADLVKQERARSSS